MVEKKMINKPDLLNLTEQQDLEQVIRTFEQYISDDVYDKAEYYEVEEDEELITRAKLFDAEGNQLVSLEVEDYDAAVEVLADMFDIDDEDIESDEWVDGLEE
jgi:hypothetical protein